MAPTCRRVTVACLLGLWIALGLQEASAADPKTDCCVRIKAQAMSRTPGGGFKGLIPISYKGVPGRNGRYFLPPGYIGRATPIMVVLHGAGDSGASMVNVFYQLAEKYRFIIVAPDSMDALHWGQVDDDKPFSTDWEHVQACYQYVTTLPHVIKNRSRIVYAGFSRGGYSAGALASRFAEATHGLVMHSAVTPQQIGTHVVPIRFSTGNKDTLFTIPRMTALIKTMKDLRPKFKCHLRVYSGDHQMNCPGEMEANVRWWLTGEAPPSPVKT